MYKRRPGKSCFSEHYLSPHRLLPLLHSVCRIEYCRKWYHWRGPCPEGLGPSQLADSSSLPAYAYILLLSIKHVCRKRSISPQLYHQPLTELKALKDWKPIMRLIGRSESPKYALTAQKDLCSLCIIGISHTFPISSVCLTDLQPCLYKTELTLFCLLLADPYGNAWPGSMAVLQLIN